MSFFTKLFSKISEAPTKVLQNPDLPRAPIYRAPRVSSNLKKLCFKKDGVMENSAAGDVFIANISTTGVGLVNGKHQWPPIGSILTGNLIISERSFPIRIEIKHRGEKIVGGRYLDEPVELKRAITEYLRLEILGLNLEPVMSEFFRKPKQGQALWFTDSGANELYLVREAHGLLTFSLVCLGLYVGWNTEQGSEVGYVISDEEEIDSELENSLVGVRRGLKVRLIDSYPPEITDQSLRFIESIKSLDAETKDSLKKKISEILVLPSPRT